MTISHNRDGWIRLLAFATIYFVWGSTYLAIRVGLRSLPPVLFAAMRFVAAGIILLLWASLKRERLPRGREWLSIAFLGSLFFLIDYGLLFWAEQRVDSGLAAVLMATIPIFMTVCEALILKSIHFTGRLVASLLLGSAGVCVLMGQSFHPATAAIDVRGILALLLAAVSWSFGSVISRRLPLPASKGISAGSQMLAGGVLLSFVAASIGEVHRFHFTQVPEVAWFCLLYLILPGSVFGFTAYLWLLHRESPTKVGTYAYVNPVVAVLIGVLFAGEKIGPQTAMASALIVISVVLVTINSVSRKTISIDVAQDRKQLSSR